MKNAALSIESPALKQGGLITLKNADPRVKLLWVLLTTTGALLFSRPLWMIGLSLFTLFGVFLLGGDLSSFVRHFSRFLPFLLMIALLQFLFVRSGRPLLKINDFALVTSEGLLLGTLTVMRLFIILSVATVMAQENSRRVIAALTRMGLPYPFSFTLLTALRFLPFFSSAFSDALIALQLRGVEPGKIPLKKKQRLYGSLVLPVVADSITKAQNLAMAMEARGFGAMSKRSSYIDVTLDQKDWLALAVLLGAAGAAFWFYYCF